MEEFTENIETTNYGKGVKYLFESYEDRVNAANKLFDKLNDSHFSNERKVKLFKLPIPANCNYKYPNNPPTVKRIVTIYKNRDPDSNIQIEYQNDATKEHEIEYVISCKSYGHIRETTEVYRTCISIKLINGDVPDMAEYVDNILKWGPLDTFKLTQKEFIKEELTNEEKEILASYTYQGDRIINSLLRNQGIAEKDSEILPHIKNIPDKIKEIAKKGGEVETSVPTPAEIKKRPITDIIGTLRPFLYKFLNVFQRVPLLKEEIKVYRGIDSEVGLKLDDNQFLSTTYVKSIATNFINDSKNCCLLNITLKPGVPVLYIEPLSEFKKEHEILIGPPFKSEIKKGDLYNGIQTYNVTISPKLTGSGVTYKRKRKNRRNTRRNKNKK